MVKLTKVKLFSGLCGVFILGSAYFLSSPLHEEDASTSIFGRNIYSESDEIGKTADPNYIIRFPDDHMSHELFDIEWWYLTANLKDQFGNPYGLQWTLFRYRNPNAPVSEESSKELAWHNNQMFMAHASIHSVSDHWFSEKFARGGVGNAGLTQKPFSLAIDNWLWENSLDSAQMFPADISFSAINKSDQPSTVNVSLSMQQTGPFVLHGNNGYSVKSTANHASHYYSAPFISIEGSLTITTPDERSQDIELTGQAWFDHEWTSELLDENTLGWDWVSLHLDNGAKLMAFRMRLRDQEDFITGSYINSKGEQTTLAPQSINLSPLSETIVLGKALPLKWNLVIPSKDVDIVITSIKENQWNDASIPYYEGMVEISGSHGGEGFIELTGY